MLDLPTVTLACADTANPDLALRALARSCDGVWYGRVLFFTSGGRAADTPAAIETVTIAPLVSREAYSRFLLKELVAYVDTAHVLVVQWDGYVVNPAAFDPAFLDCDYLGAKWYWYDDGMRVGNGGFSLRSRKLLEALRDERVQLSEAEDLTICRTYRRLLEREHGIRFGDESLADRFAFEAAYPVGRPFGFHGLFNFCRVVPPTELASLAPRFTDTIASSPQCAQLLRNCVALAQWAPAIALGRRMLQAIPNAETRALLAHAEAGAAAGVGIGRNDPCPCGSGRRYKQCHGAVGRTVAATASAPSADERVASGIAAHRQGDLATAETRYRDALAQAPEHPYALHYLGVVHFQRDALDDAFPLLRRAVALQPEEPEFHNNLGLALARAERDTEAIEAFGRALALAPQHAGAHNNLGLSLRAVGRVDDAIAEYRQALSLDSRFLEAQWNLALALLANREFAEGWRAYDTRLALGVFQSDLAPPPGPRWDGGDPAGKTLLLTTEQGLGDAIQFVRFARVLERMGARVHLRAPSSLAALFRTVPGVADVIGANQHPARYDAHVALLSLPGLLGVTEQTIPAEIPYLQPDSRMRERIRQQLRDAGPEFRVGLAWRGSVKNAEDRRRSMALAVLSPLLSVPGVRWFSLQKDELESERSAPLARLDARDTMDGTAALVAELDLVVTVDTSIAHLAGAIGVPLWVMLAFAPDWRWGVAGQHSAWYPSARLFRQRSPGDWASVVEAVREALAAHLHGEHQALSSRNA